MVVRRTARREEIAFALLQFEREHTLLREGEFEVDVSDVDELAVLCAEGRELRRQHEIDWRKWTQQWERWLGGKMELV